MKNLSRFVHIAMLAGLVAAGAARAQTMASDNGGNYGGTISGDGGSGYDAWTILTVDTAGFFDGGSDFGAYANGGANAQVTGFRQFNFTDATSGAKDFPVGSEFRIFIDLNGINSGGFIDFNFRNGNTSGAVSDNTSGSRLKFRFTGGESFWKVNDVDSMFAYSDLDGKILTVRLTSANSVYIGANGKSTNYTLGGTADAPINSFAISDYKNYGPGGGDLRFNDLIVEGNGTTIWDGGASDDNSSSANNWRGNRSIVSGDYWVFAGQSRTSPTIDAKYDVDGIALDSAANGFTLGTSGGAFTITVQTSNTIGIVNNSGNTLTIHTPITNGNSQTWFAKGGPLYVYGTVDLGANRTNTLRTGGSNNLRITNLVSGSASKLLLNSAAVLDDASALYIASGVTFDLNGFSETIGSLAGTGTVTMGSAQLIAGQNNADTTYGGEFKGNSTASFVKKGTGTMRLTGTSTLSGQVYVVGGALSIDASQGASFTNTINLGETSGSDAATLAIGGGGTTVVNPVTVRFGSTGSRTIQNTSSGAGIFSGNVALNTDVTVVATSGTLSFTGTEFDLKNQLLVVTGANDSVISASLKNSIGTGKLNKLGTGTLTLSGNNTLSGNINVSNGALKVANGAGSASGSGAVNVNVSGTITGTGSVFKLNVGNGGTLAPGLSPGTLTAGDTTLDTNGVYVWEINDFSGAYGSDPGWDRLSCTGTLTIAATAANTFTVRVTSLTYANISGTSSNFNNSNGYTQLIASAVSISGFATNKFTLNTSAFSNPFGGNWTIALVDSTNIAVVYTPPAAADVIVIGNNLIINDGDTSPALADHTDFGSVHADTGLLTRTFTITNSGASAVGLGNVTTSGTHAAEFIVTSQPATEIAAGATTTLQVQFNPASIGSRTATLQFTNTVPSKTPYDFAVQGDGVWPGIGVSPTNFSLTAMVGDAIGNQTFGVTNIGTGTLDYTITAASRSNFLAVAATSGSLGAGAGKQHTNTITTTGLSAGTYGGTNTVSDPAASNSPQRVTVLLTLTNIPSPTSVSAINDGNQLVRLTAAEAAGRQILIFHSLENSSSDFPTNGSSYAVGDVVGNSRVAFKFTGSSTISNLEHVVAAGKTNYYRFYAINNNHYSLSADASATTGVYRANVIIETMSYTQSVSLASRGGGSGWASNWVVVNGTYTARTNATTPNLISNSGYPAATGNKIEIADPGNGGDSDAYRSFPNVTSGRLYVSFLMAYEFAGANKYAGLSFMSNATERAFIGEVFSADKKLGIDVSGSTTTSTFDLNPFAGGGGDTGNTYLVVGRYDFATRELRTKAYYRTTATTQFEPQNWDATNILPVGRMNLCNGVRLIGGAGTAGDGTVGRIFFDEIRVATNWPNLLDADATYPYATNFVVNGGTNLTDAQVKSGSFEVVYHLRDGVGIESQKTLDPYFAPNFDLFNANGVQILSNEAFSSFSYLDAFTYVGTDATHAAVSASQVTLGTYTSRWSAVNSNGLSVVDYGTYSNGTPITFTVVDDDTNGPVHGMFYGDGVPLTGASFNFADVRPHFHITGTVTDSVSGVYGGTSNRYRITGSDGVEDSGDLIAGFSDGGAMSGGSLSNTVVLPPTEGVHTLEVVSVDFDLDRPGDSLTTTSLYLFTIGPQPQQPVLAISVTSVTQQIMFGNSAAPFDLIVTNEDYGTLIYTNYQTYGVGASGWLSITPSEGSIKWPKHQHSTGTIASASFTNAGTYVATNRVDGNQVNTAQYVIVTIVVSNIPEAQSLGATADGNELVRLTAAEAAGREVLVFHSLENSGLDFPTNGTAYTNGSVIGSSRVIFKFTGSSTVSNLEHVVAADSTNYYRFYAINNNHYSTGTTVSVVMGAYPGSASIEQIAYTNGTALHGQGGGSGWSGTWSVSGGNGWTNIANGGTPNVVPMPFYPTRRANILKMSNPGNGASRTASRSFATYTNGSIYAAWMMAYDFSGANKFAGISLMSNGVEKAFIGEIGGTDRRLGLDSFGTGSPSTSSFDMNPLTGGTAVDTGNVYLVVASYDFATRALRTKAYYRTTSVPLSEPVTWDASVTVDAGRINQVDGIRFLAGSTDAGATVGNVYFDELRVASSWSALIDETRPHLTNYVVGTTNFVSDAQMNNGNYSITFDFYSRAGMTNSATVPNVDILDPSGNQLVADRAFATFAYSDNGRRLLASNSSVTAVSAANVVLGVHTSRWSAFDSNGVSVINSTTLSNGTAATFTVYDDDVAAPLFGTALGGRAMDFTIGGTNYASGSGTGGVFAVTDGDLAQVSAANPMKFIFNVFDSDSAMQRATAGTATTNLNFDVGAAGPTNIFATFSNGLSSADTTLAIATSVFYHTAPFTIGGSGFSETGEVFKMITAATNRITVSAYDRDLDRTNDVLNIIDQQAGLLVVTDDDTTPPVAELLYVGTNYTFGATNDLTITDADLFAGGSVDIAYRWFDLSGMFVTNTDLTKTNAFSEQGNESMNWDLTNANYQVGTADRIHSPVEQHGSNGDQYITNVLLNIQAVPFTNNSLTTWFLSVSAQDHDFDRGSFDPGAGQAGTIVSYDRAVRTNQTLAFSVVDDDTTGPSAVTQSVILAIGGEWTNAQSLVVTWDTNGVVDSSGILGYRVATNAPADIFGGTNAGSGTSYVWNVSAAHEGILTNYLYALDADGDRTNDFMYGSSVNFTSKLDRTPPALVTNLAITITGVTDDSTQLKLTWSMLTNAGSRASDGDPLSPWKSYVVFYTTDETTPTTNSASIRSSNGPPDLGTNTTTLLIMSNLLNDTVYKMALVGLDVAGNYGPLSATVTQRTTGLILAQSIVNANNGVTIRWNLKSDLPYDVIYQDATSWANNLTNNWQLLRTVTNEFPIDTGTTVRTPPVNLGATMRFYRVSATDQWRTNNPTRVATREIMVAKSFTLVPGENWLALPFDPVSNTVAEIFGTDRLPTGVTIATATKISWYSATNSALATNVIWLASSNRWICSIGGTGIADHMPIPLTEGFNIEIPGAVNQQLVLSGRVTTNAYVGTIRPGNSIANTETYSVRARPIPHRVTLGQSGLKGALTGATATGLGPDEIRILNNTSGQGSKTTSRIRAWLRSTDNTFRRYDSPTFSSAENDIIEPGDTIIIVRRGSGERVYTNALPYSLPGRNINP